MLHFLICPSSLGYTSQTLANGHWFQIPLSSLEITISLILKFLCGWFHFCRFLEILHKLLSQSWPELICQVLNFPPLFATGQIFSLKVPRRRQHNLWFHGEMLNWKGIHSQPFSCKYALISLGPAHSMRSLIHYSLQQSLCLDLNGYS